MRILPLVVLALALSAPPAWATTIFATPRVPLVMGDVVSPLIPMFPDRTRPLGMEASASTMAWPWPISRGCDGFGHSVDGSIFQPCTVGFSGNGRRFLRVHPFTGQPFGSEMAVLSWNALMALVESSTPGTPGATGIQYFDRRHPFRSDGCSFLRPGSCVSVQVPAAVPEPGAFLLFALGLAAVGLGTRRR
jgi:hypothetical protein